MAYEDITRAPAAQSYGPLDLGIYPQLAPLLQNIAANIRANRQQKFEEEQAKLDADAKAQKEQIEYGYKDRSEAAALRKEGFEYGYDVPGRVVERETVGPQNPVGPEGPRSTVPSGTEVVEMPGYRVPGLRQQEAARRSDESESRGTSREEAARLAEDRLKLAKERLEWEKQDADRKRAEVEEDNQERDLAQMQRTVFAQNEGLMSRSATFKYDPNNPEMKMARKRAWQHVVASDKSGRLKRIQGLDKEQLEEFLASRASYGTAARYAVYRRYEEGG